MNKNKLQQELKEKIKKGIKPSDLKKQGKKNSPNKNNIQTNNQLLTPPDSPVLQPTKTDNLISEISENKEVKELEKQKIQDPEHILEKPNPDKEKVKILETENKNLNKTIEELKNKQESKEESKGEIKLFTCYHCHQDQVISLLVLELPEGKLCQPCWKLLRKKTKEQVKINKPFTCHNCQEKKEEREYKVRLNATPQLYSICPPCLPLIKEYNEKEQDSERELDIWE